MQTPKASRMVWEIMTRQPTPGGDASASRMVQAVNTSCRIVETLHELGDAGITEVANRLDLSKAAVHSHLSTLEANEFVVKEGSRYRLSLRYLGIGEAVRRLNELYSTGQSEVENLAKQTGELAHLVVEEHGCGVFIYRAGGEDAVWVKVSQPGRRDYLHCTAAGKALLAELPEERVEEILERHGLPAITGQTITDKTELIEQLTEIRDRGWAIDDEERVDGFRGVAASILGDQGKLVGAISVSGPVGRLNGTVLEETIPEKVTNAANVIEINIRYH